jgi:hypothetical protein
MNKQKLTALNRDIRIYWWNIGTKSLDFEGTYKEWFEKNKINIIAKGSYIYFSGEFGNMKFKIRLGNDFEHSFNQIIKLCLVYLGDKAQLIDGFNRTYNINYR